MLAAQKKLGIIDPVSAAVIITGAVKVFNAVIGDKCKRNCDFKFLFKLGKRRKCKCQCVADNPGTKFPSKETPETCAARGVNVSPVIVSDDAALNPELQPGGFEVEKAQVNPVLSLGLIGAGLTFFT